MRFVTALSLGVGVGSAVGGFFLGLAGYERYGAYLMSFALFSFAISFYTEKDL